MSAIETIQQMQAAGVHWEVKKGAVKLQSGSNVHPELIKSINKNKKEVMRLLCKNPKSEHLALLAELNTLNSRWRELALEAEQYIPITDPTSQIVYWSNKTGETADKPDTLTQLEAICIRAGEVWDTLQKECHGLLENMCFLEPLEANQCQR